MIQDFLFDWVRVDSLTKPLIFFFNTTTVLNLLCTFHQKCSWVPCMFSLQRAYLVFHRKVRCKTLGTRAEKQKNILQVTLPPVSRLVKYLPTLQQFITMPWCWSYDHTVVARTLCDFIRWSFTSFRLAAKSYGPIGMNILRLSEKRELLRLAIILIPNQFIFQTVWLAPMHKDCHIIS